MSFITVIFFYCKFHRIGRGTQCIKIALQNNLRTGQRIHNYNYTFFNSQCFVLRNNNISGHSDHTAFSPNSVNLSRNTAVISH